MPPTKPWRYRFCSGVKSPDIEASRSLRQRKCGPEGKHAAQMRDIGAAANHVEVPETISRVAKEHGAGQPVLAHHEFLIGLRSLVLEDYGLTPLGFEDLAR